MSDIIDNEDKVIDGFNLRGTPGLGNSAEGGIKAAQAIVGDIPAAAKSVAPIPNLKIKERIPNTIKIGDHELTPAEVIELSNKVEENLRSRAVGASEKAKPAIKELDYTKLTLDAIYDLSIPIEAKAFGANDPLKVDLKDKNYEPRWVFKDPRRLGQMRAYGFIYVTMEDLAKELEVEVTPDAEGHFSLDDVVLMRIPKVKYYAMMRANHERSLTTMSATGAAKNAQVAAETFMSKNAGGEYASYAEQGKINFYKPGIEI